MSSALVERVTNAKPHQRWRQSMLLPCLLVGSWLGMQAVHEFGHVSAAWLTGGHVSKVVLHPLTISRTDLSHNPAPVFVVWGGPVTGSLLPILIWLLFRQIDPALGAVARFFAGFCLIANGAYIGVGSWDGIGDCGELLKLGTPRPQMWLFGGVTVPTGLALWNGLGPQFGFGTNPHPVPVRMVWYTAGMLVGCLALGLIVGS